MAKIMIGLRVSPKFKKVLEQEAKAENRTLANFIKNSVIKYLKQEKGVEYNEQDDKIIRN